MCVCVESRRRETKGEAVDGRDEVNMNGSPEALKLLFMEVRDEKRSEGKG